MRGIVGLYLDPLDRALVLCVDEKSQIQALDRTAPTLPLRPVLPERQTHNYKRHGTTPLFAAFNILNGKVIDRCQHRSVGTLQISSLFSKQDVINFQKTLDQFPFHDGERQVFQLTLLRPTVNEALTILITLSGERERNIPRTTLKQLEVVLRTHRSADSRPFFKRAHCLRKLE